MTGAMYAAIAGLRTHMSNLNVIGHNIANVNTTAYKPHRSVFRTALYTQVSGGSDGSTTSGGVNPSQVGYGSNLATISKDMSTGTYAPGQPTDCMIDGDGFFMVGTKDAAELINPQDPSTLTALTLTRTGDFEFKSDGYLCDGIGNPVYGFLVTGVNATTGKPIFSDQLVPIRLPRQDTDGSILYPYQAGEDGTGRLTDNLYGMGDDGKPATPENAADAANQERKYAQLDSISFDRKTGQITGTVKGTDQVITVGCIAIANVTNPAGLTEESNTYYKVGKGSGDMTVNLMGGLEEEIWGTGAHYINQSLLGDQQDADALNNLPRNSQIGSAGTTEMISGGLELSKTDLATEISNMITTQRGYQANTRIITVTDSMLEELVNMKR